MWKRRICYLLLLGEGCYLIMLYNFWGLRFLLCCLIFIPLICLLLLIPAACTCKVILTAEQKLLTRGEALELAVTVENGGLLPAAGVLVQVSFKAPGEKEIKMKRRLRGLGQKSGQKLFFELSAAHCGKAEFQVKKACVCDYLGLFSLPTSFLWKKKFRVEIGVSPRVTPIAQEEAAVVSLCCLGMTGERDGDMFLRDYQAGDSPYRIYWKLWVKKQELQIRDFEQTDSLVVFLDFSSEFKNQLEQWDAYLDRACSLLSFFAEEGAAAQRLLAVAWRQEELILKAELADAEALQAWAEALLLEKPQGTVVSQESLSDCGTVFRLKEDCRLYYGEQCI